MEASNRSIESALSQFPVETGSLIPLLQIMQEAAGYISSDSVQQIAEYLKLTESQVYGVASFYAQFRFTPPARHSLIVCLGTACHVRGGERLMTALQRDLDTVPGSSTRDGRFDLNRVACLGCCALSPVVKIDRDIYSNMTNLKLKRILDAYK